MDKTLIYITENKCPEPLFTAAINHLKEVAEGYPIVSVSHKPVDLGTNICVGEHKRSWVCLYRQVLAGCKEAKTRHVSIIEHDCFYTREHVEWEPPTDDKFYYNENVLLVCWDKKNHPDKMGMYSKFWRHPRLSLSQLVCNRQLYIKALEQRLDLIDRDRQATKRIDHLTEPGASKESAKYKKKLIDRANSGSSAYLKTLLPDFIELEEYETFNNRIPNLDVRHGRNFTGPRRGRKRRYKIKHWGRFEDLINGKNMG